MNGWPVRFQWTGYIESIKEEEMVNEKFAAQIYGVARTAKTNCVCHNEPQDRSTFGDEISFKEFGISGLCQREQDAIFGDDEGFPIEDDT